MKTTIRFHVGGPDFHPVAEQAQLIAQWLGDRYACDLREGGAAFDDLEKVDLLVVMGLFWTGGEGYEPLSSARQQSFAAYVASGRPVLAHHGGIASYDDWPRFGELLGFTWVWGTTEHSPVGEWAVRVLPTGHAVVAGVSDFELTDELYFDVKVSDGLTPTAHAEADYADRKLPMVLTGEGGRTGGAGKTAWLANGHDMRAFAAPAMKQLWINATRWLTEQD